MRRLRKMAAAIIALAMIFSLSGCKLISKTEQGVYNTVVAKVSGKKLIKGEYDKQLAIQKLYLESYYGYDFFEGDTGKSYLSYIQSNVLEQMVHDQVIMDKAKEMNLISDEAALTEEAQKKLDEYMNSLSDKDKFNDALEKSKLTNDDLLGFFRNNVIYQKVYDESTKDVTVTDDDVKKYYDENPYEFTEKDNIMNLSHILVGTEAEANLVKDRLKGGESFEDVAKQVSTDTGTKEEGGLLGDVPYVNSGYVQEFMDAALKLSEGQISAPVKSQYGYHIIKCNSKTEYPEKPFDSVKEDIKTKLLSDKKDTTFDSSYNTWKEAAKVKTYSDRI